MEEQECEIVFVSNKSQKKKENILEALTKYKLKHQEEQQHTFETKGNVIVNDSSPLSVKGEVANQTSQRTKRKNFRLKKQSSVKRKSQFTAINGNQYDKNERNRILTEYLENSVKCESKLYLRKDCEIGITEYISQGQGFSAVDINHSLTDFQVLHIVIHVKFM
jgi:tRNA pseudouridine13 synthase